MRIFAVNSRFNPCRLMITCNAKDALPSRSANAAIQRHLRGGWGDVCASDGRVNDDALKSGGRLLSVYHTQDDELVWTITESDRSATTVLLPSDY